MTHPGGVSGTAAPVSDPASVYAHSLEARRLGASLTWRYRLQRVLVKGVVHTLFKVEAEGLDRWPPGPFQLVTNHHSGWDPLLVGAIALTATSRYLLAKVRKLRRAAAFGLRDPS